MKPWKYTWKCYQFHLLSDCSGVLTKPVSLPFLKNWLKRTILTTCVQLLIVLNYVEKVVSLFFLSLLCEYWLCIDIVLMNNGLFRSFSSTQPTARPVGATGYQWHRTGHSEHQPAHAPAGTQQSGRICTTP